MSRIGKLPIPLAPQTTAVVDGARIRVKGPKGELSRVLPVGVVVRQEGNTLFVARDDDSRQNRSNHGLARALVANMVKGVGTGFERRLEVLGVGFKGELKGRTLNLSLGFSHVVEFPLPEGISVDVEKGTKFVVRGADRELVGETAARLRRLRSPDSYKGKGVRFDGEKVRIKAGKTAKK